MRKLHFAITAAFLFIATAAASADVAFRQRVRDMQGSYRIWQRDDGGVTTEINCTTGEQDTMDGGTWPLKNPVAYADGGLPNNVFSSCARRLEAQNGLDGGLL